MSVSILSRRAFFAAAFAVSFAAAAGAHEFKVGTIEIGHPWSRATPGGASVGAGYLVLKNTGAEPDRLVSVSVPFAGRVEIHEVVTSDGVASMKPVPDGVVIPAGGSVAFKPGSYHLMFFDLKQPLKEGESLDGTLAFAKAGSVAVQFKVEKVGFGGDGGGQGGAHKGH